MCKMRYVILQKNSRNRVTCALVPCPNHHPVTTSCWMPFPLSVGSNSRRCWLMRCPPLQTTKDDCELSELSPLDNANACDHASELGTAIAGQVSVLGTQLAELVDVGNRPDAFDFTEVVLSLIFEFLIFLDALDFRGVTRRWSRLGRREWYRRASALLRSRCTSANLHCLLIYATTLPNDYYTISIP
jgi:hypothetical protein